MSKPVCVNCKVEFSVVRTGVAVLEYGGGNKFIYKLTSGDKWKCPKCGTEIVVGFGVNPIARVGDQDFEQLVKSHREKGTLVECYEYIDVHSVVAKYHESDS